MPAQKTSLLPTLVAPKVTQKSGAASLGALDKVEHLLVAAPQSPAASLWKQIPGGSRLQLLRKRRKQAGHSFTRLANTAQTGVSFDTVPDSASGKQLPGEFELLTFAGKLAAATLNDNPATVAILVVGFQPEHAERIVRALVLALQAHTFRLPTYKATATAAPRLRSIRIVGLTEDLDLSRVIAEARATNLARWLTAQPPNKLTMPSYQDALQELSKEQGWQSKFFDTNALRKLNAGAFLAVAQGNRTPGAGIMRLRYRPAGTTASTRPQVSLVGKGIIFDTGGTNLKPFKAMLDMHHDMAGSAVAVATLLVLSELQVPFAVDCWLAITENRISGDAYKSRDIVTASNGTTIEVIHTDAEGRMALADTLALAGRDEPVTLIDFATLTGTCVAALTERYSGAFTNREALHSPIVAAGRASGERVWTFPMDADFDDDIKSSVADVLQCSPSGGGDHIQAARFLQRFVPDKSAWVHVDLSAASRSGGLAQVPGPITGFGVRFALNLLLDQLDDGTLSATTGTST